MVVPVLIVSVAGLKAKFWMVTEPDPVVDAGCVMAAGVTGDCVLVQPVTRQARISSAAHADQKSRNDWLTIVPHSVGDLKTF
jgi:hypothetical protein